MTDEDIRRALLKQRKLFGTQKELAAAIGVSEQALGRFMTGRQRCTDRHSKIFQALGLEVATVRVIRPKEKI